MQIGKDDLLAGVPAKRFRDTLLKMDSANWPRKKLQHELRLARRDMTYILLYSCQRDTSRPPIVSRDGIVPAPRPPRLLNVRFIRRIDRAKAEALVTGLVERANVINEKDRFVLCVTELRVFGSYLDPNAMDLGDIDVGFAGEVKPIYKERDVTDLSKLTRRPDIRPRSFLDFLSLPRKAVLRTLKNRSPYTSFHPIEDLAKIGIRGRTILL